MLGELDRLAESCDAGTKVVVIGHINDVILYRELLEARRQRVSGRRRCRRSSSWRASPTSTTIPRPIRSATCIAFIGAKGGVGSSTVCHNTSWALSEVVEEQRRRRRPRLAFGTTGLDFNQDPVQGIAEALSSPERLDEVLLDRLLTKCSEHLSIFAAPVLLDRDYDISADACDMVIDVVRQNVPYVARRPAAHLDVVVEAAAAAGRRGGHHRRARPRQPAQRQEHGRSPPKRSRTNDSAPHVRAEHGRACRSAPRSA